MDSFTERMLERAQKRKDRLRMQLNNPVTPLKVSPFKETVANSAENISSSDISSQRNLTLIPHEDSENIPIDAETENNHSNLENNLSSKFEKPVLNNCNISPKINQVKKKIMTEEVENVANFTTTKFTPLAEKINRWESNIKPKSQTEDSVKPIASAVRQNLSAVKNAEKKVPAKAQVFSPTKVTTEQPISSPKASESLSPKKGSVLERASLYGGTQSPKRAVNKDPAELSLAERKALFEKNKGDALIPKVPFSQPLPTPKKNSTSKIQAHQVQVKSDVPKPGNFSQNVAKFNKPEEKPLSPTAPPLPPKPMKAIVSPKINHFNEDPPESDEENANVDTDQKVQNISAESFASSESSLGQKIVRLAQKRTKEIEDRKKRSTGNIQYFDEDEDENDIDEANPNYESLDNPLSRPSPPKLSRSSESSEANTEIEAETYPCQNPLENMTRKNENFNEVDDPEQPLTHTISFYRKLQNQNEIPTASSNYKKIVHQSDNSISFNDSEIDEELEREAVSSKIAELQQRISAETTVISQATQALNLCFSTIEFTESTEQIEAERLLLLATHKRQAALNEVQRLKVEGTLKPNKPNTSVLMDQGSLTVSDIALPVKIEAIRTAAREEKCHHLVCLLKCDDVVLGTSIVAAAGKDLLQTSNGTVYVQFPNVVTFPKLYSDFRVTIEVYDLLARSKEILPHDIKYHICCKKDNSKLKMTPKKSKNNSRLVMPIVQSPGGPSAVRTSKFSMVGYIVFSLREVQRTQFTLNKVTYTSPIEGKVQLKLSCELSPTIEHRGFLTMFEDVSGFGAWHRRWCLLKGDSLSYWKYPDDERIKLPMDTIDLNTCTAESINVVSRDICARPNTFLLETIRPARDEDVDSLVSVRHASHTMVRYLLSTDTKEERMEWCAILNKALAIIRAWRKK